MQNYSFGNREHFTMKAKNQQTELEKSIIMPKINKNISNKSYISAIKT